MFNLFDQSGFAFGPQPRFVLQPTQLAQLARGVANPYGLFDHARKAEAYKAFLVWKGDHAHLVAGKIVKTQDSPDVRRDMAKFIDVSANPGRDIARDLCKVWSQGAQREVDGVTEDQQAAVMDLIRESWLDVHLPRWNQLAFMAGPVTALPVVRSEKMTFDVLLPHFYDVARNVDEPYGPPLAAAWTVGDDQLGALFGHHHLQRTTIAVDGDAWHYVGAGGTEYQRVPHGIDRFPGSTLRMNLPYDVDWWGCEENKRLADGSVTISLINTALNFVRKSQNKYLMTLFGALDGMPKGQTTDPEHPLVARTSAPNQVNLEIHDFNLDPANAIKHALWYYQVLAQAYGGSVVAQQSGSELYASVEFSHDALTEVRNEQIPFARAFEHDLVAVMVMVAKDSRHPLADRLPDPQAILDGYRVTFPRLARSFANPKDEMAWWDWTLSKGAAHHGQLVASLSGHTISAQDGIKVVMDNVDEQIPMLGKLTKRDLTTNPQANTDFEKPSQIFGSMGGQASPDGDEETEDQDDG